VSFLSLFYIQVLVFLRETSFRHSFLLFIKSIPNNITPIEDFTTSIMALGTDLYWPLFLPDSFPILHLISLSLHLSYTILFFSSFSFVRLLPLVYVYFLYLICTSFISCSIMQIQRILSSCWLKRFMIEFPLYSPYLIIIYYRTCAY